MMTFDDKVGGWGWLNDDVIRQCPSSLSKLTGNLFVLSRISLISLIQVTDLFSSEKMN